MNWTNEGRKIALNAYSACDRCMRTHSIGLSINHLYWFRRVRKKIFTYRIFNANVFEITVFMQPFDRFSVRLTVHISGQPIQKKHSHICTLLLLLLTIDAFFYLLIVPREKAVSPSISTRFHFYLLYIDFSCYLF